MLNSTKFTQRPTALMWEVSWHPHEDAPLTRRQFNSYSEAQAFAKTLPSAMDGSIARRRCYAACCAQKDA